MTSLMPICSVDKVSTIPCSMQFTAARFWPELHLKYIAASQIGMCASAFRACT